MFNSLSQQLDDEKKRGVAAVQILTIAENSNADLRKKLTVKKQARKSADAALKGVEKQAESQRKLTNEAKEQLTASKEQVAALKHQLEEAQKPECRLRKTRPKLKKKEMRPSSTTTTSV